MDLLQKRGCGRGCNVTWKTGGEPPVGGGTRGGRGSYRGNQERSAGHTMGRHFVQQSMKK